MVAPVAQLGNMGVPWKRRQVWTRYIMDGTTDKIP